MVEVAQTSDIPDASSNSNVMIQDEEPEQSPVENETRKSLRERRKIVQNKKPSKPKESGAKQVLESKANTSSTKKEKFPCPLCTKEFQNKSGRYNHIKLHHKVKLDFGKVHCLEAGCLFSCTYTTVLQQHLTNAHNIPMKYLNLEFDNYEDFEKWKHNYETGEVCRFVKKSGSRVGEAGKSMYLYCSRSGTFVSQGKGHRFKKLGTAKISAHCTALIKYFEESTGKVKASVCTTHYGHDKDHRYLRLTKVQKRHIAEKMKAGMSRDLVLESLRSTFVNKLDRIHELSKRDLSNIQTLYKIPKTVDRRKSQGAGVAPMNPLDLVKDDWIGDINENTESPILYHKDINTENGKLTVKDKCLIIMTKGQKDLFLKFCNNGVMYVTIFRLSPVINLYLTVIFILDDFYEMFPVCFLISNNTRSEVLELYFGEILSVIGPVSLRAFATDDNETVYNAWNQVMGPTSNHIIANRYVDTEWRKNLTMVEDEAVQGEIYDKLYDFIERTDGTDEKMSSLIQDLRVSVTTNEFASYLDKNYLKNIHSWSSYYLKEELGLREPIDYETSYSKVSSLCEICCKYNKPVSYGAKGLIKLLLEFQSNRNRKVAENVVEINSAHDSSVSCGIENVFPYKNNVWKVLMSGSDVIFEVNVETCNFDECVLMCERCESCVHNFQCICDNYVDGRTCIHVHLVGLMLKKLKNDSEADEKAKSLFQLEDLSKALVNESETSTEIDSETHSLKLESLAMLEEIGRKVLKEKNEKTIHHLFSLIKEFRGNMDVLSNYGSHAKNMSFVKSSKLDKKVKKVKKVVTPPKRKITRQGVSRKKAS